MYNQAQQTQWSGNASTSGYVAIGVESPPPPKLVEAVEVQHKTIAYGHEIVARIASALDRLAGSEPTAVGPKSQSPARAAGVLGGLGEVQESMEALNSRLNEIADRLCRIV